MNTQKVVTMDSTAHKLFEFPLGLPGTGFKYTKLQPFVLFLLLLLFWFLLPAWLTGIDPTIGTVDQGIWLLVLLSLITFLIVLALCWWLLQQMWLKLGLTPIQKIVSQFNTLSLWQQLSFYWASFALLLLAVSIIIIAIC